MRCFIYLQLISLLLLACSNEKEKDQPASSHQVADHKAAGHNHNATATGSADSSLQQVVYAANKVVLSDQATVTARFADTTIRITSSGYISWDPRRNKKVPVRTGGRVERLYVKYNYQYIRSGQRIIDIYSPELNTYAAEYLHHLSTPGDEMLLIKSREKLRLLGITELQLRELDRDGFIGSSIPVFSRSAGYVIFEENSGSEVSGMQANNSGSGSAMGTGAMGGNANTGRIYPGATAGLQLREGMYVNRNQTLFYVNDFLSVWGLLSFDQSVQPLLKKGMTVIVKSELLTRPLRVPVAFIEPAFRSDEQKFMQVRVHLPNRERQLKINSLLSAELDITLTKQLIIPSSAVFSLGKRKIVWVKTGTTPNRKNIFTARDVKITLVNKNVTVVIAGLKEGEQLAADAGYLLDSQSLIEQ